MDGVLAETKPLRDVMIAQAFAHEPKHVALARGEAIEACARRAACRGIWSSGIRVESAEQLDGTSGVAHRANRLEDPSGRASIAKRV